MKKTARAKNDRGFTLLEMLIALAVFAVISAAVLSLFATDQPLFNRQQNLSSLNITIRNAISQLQLDVVNAGTGYYPGTDIPDWPVGVTISNSNPTSACNNSTTYTYSSTCFDTLNIISTDPNTPAARPDNGTFVAGDCAVTTASPIYVTPPTGTTPAQLAADYQNGDELLLVNAGNSQMTAITLTAAPTTYPTGASPKGVKLVFTANTAIPTPPTTAGTNTSAGDALGITTVYNTKLATQFCTTDWIMRLLPVTYQVDTTTATNPKLVRKQAGVTSVVAEQVIGFKVGALARNTTDLTTGYSYNSSTGYSNEWWFVRSLQVSLIARTTPVSDPTYVFRNGFDGGPYQIESAMTVINPRNLSLNNN
jgi:prepilin-type N-terminal cleavage/methylation domain-containing protein